MSEAKKKENENVTYEVEQKTKSNKRMMAYATACSELAKKKAQNK